MNSNAITMASTVVGVLVGYVTSWSFARSSKRSDEARQHGLENQLALLHDLFSGVASELGMADPSKGGPRSERPQVTGSKIQESPRGITKPEPVVDLSVRVMLGTLLNELGQVELKRLLLGMSHVASPPSVTEILGSLKRLKTLGAISWDGDDIAHASMIQVLPHGGS